MGDKNLLPSMPGISSLQDLERMIAHLSRTMGVGGLSTSQSTALDIWTTLRDLIFSVPLSPDSDSWSPEEQDRILEQYIKKTLGVGKGTFLSMTRNKIRANARARARAKEMMKALR